MRFLLAMVVLAASVPASAGTVQVKGHINKAGTYVPPHTRTTPNSTKLDNFSAKGNVNPYTGKPGTVDPFKLPKPLKPYKPK